MLKKIIFPVAVLFGGQLFLFGQGSLDSIKEANVAATINMLASDSFCGRGNGTPDILKAGLYIGNRFKEAGLFPLTGQPGYYITFTLPGHEEQAVTDVLQWNGQIVNPDRVMYMPHQPGNYIPKNISDFKIINIDTCFHENILKEYASATDNLIIRTSQMQPGKESFFPDLIKVPYGGIQKDFLLVYAESKLESITLTGLHSYYSAQGYNIVGMLPGKSKPNEVVIFSAHYDHVGISGRNKRDSIMNGANDNASGVTAVLMLADYFARQGNNERTILFCAFAGEELGLVGSKNFRNYLIPESIVAVINIEMIALPQYGKNNFFITGTRYSDLPALLKTNMKGLNVKVKPEPNQKKKLFQRSDNFSFALKGIPAHTIMSSDDYDPCYHRPCDEANRADTKHMTQIIKAIVLGTKSIIGGVETPTRTKPDDLR
jgi:Peptidase family M28